MATFNLVTEPWIPVMTDIRSSPELVTLPDLFARAPTLWHIADPSPLTTIALYRLLLAVLHRAYQGPTPALWENIWQQGTFDTGRIHAYLTQWQQRFDLFDATHPFYQTAGLHTLVKETKPASQLLFERASDRNRALLFDHSAPDFALPPDEAARALLATQAFSVGGMITSEHVDHKFAKASPLSGCAVCLVRGETIFETLLLNWLRYTPTNGYRIDARDRDAPAWERDEPTRSGDRYPDGYTDLLTWQSRRIQLFPTVTTAGTVTIDQVLIMKGYSFAPAFEPKDHETMVAYRKDTRTKAASPWRPIGLRADRLVWRDSYALLHTVQDASASLPTLAWLGNEVSDVFAESTHLRPLDIYGFITDQASYMDWRRESLPFAPVLLQQPQLMETIKIALEVANASERWLKATEIAMKSSQKGPSPFLLLCTSYLRNADDPWHWHGHTLKKEALDRVTIQCSRVLLYWSALEQPFRQLLHALIQETPNSDLVFGEGPLLLWKAQVYTAVHRSFQSSCRALGSSAAALRAVALSRDYLGVCSHQLRFSQERTVTV